MATGKDLINAVRESLERDGELGKIKAELEMKIIELLDSSTPSSHKKKPDLPKDVVIINEIIMEYLNWIGYKHTSTVFKSECDCGNRRLERSFITQDLGIKDTDESEKLPLLISLIDTFKARKLSLKN